MKYKSSMFNRILEKDADLVLYNSFRGTKNLVRVLSEKADKVCKWLADDVVDEHDDPDFSKLVNLGYLVSESTDEKRLRRLRYIEHIANNRLQLVIHVTKSCNFRCAYCYMDFEPEMISQDVQKGIVNYVCKNIQKFKAVQFSWFGGEPTLGMAAIENVSYPIIDICRKQRKPYNAIITTNGYNLTPENVNKLLTCHVTHIAVTIDGIQELHDRQRMLADGSPTFQRIIQNLLYIRDNVKTQTLTISIRTNITKKHLPYLEKYYHFYNELFGKDHRFSLFIRPVADYGGGRVKSLKNDFIYDMHTVYDSLRRVQTNIKFFPNFIDLEVGGYTCTAKQLYKYTIGCDGSISKCDESLKNPIGYLSMDGIMTIDEAKHSEWILGGEKEECDNCFFSGSCFMELCPKARIDSAADECPVKLDDIDSLILFAADTYKVEIL